MDSIESGSDVDPHGLPAVVQDRERVGLLRGQRRSYGAVEDDARQYAEALDPIADRPDIHWPTRIKFAEAPMRWVYSSISPPLWGAIIAVTLGVRPLHVLTLSKFGLIACIDHSSVP